MRPKTTNAALNATQGKTFLLRQSKAPSIMTLVIRRFYVHNFRCLENFELLMADRTSILLLGKNGAGKSTVGFALRNLQKIARGVNRVRDFVTPNDLTHGRADVPVRFEMEAMVAGRVFNYAIAFEFPAGFKELRVADERLLVDGQPIFTRELAQVHLGANPENEARFTLDWHLAALPLIQHRSPTEPLFLFREWLARMIILRPTTQKMEGDSDDETLRPNPDGADFGAWFSGLIASAPAAYSEIDRYLKQVMPDLQDIKNPSTGKDSRTLEVQFTSDQRTVTLPFKSLSDGEKSFMLCAMVLAASKSYGPIVCFWDEPDNHLALSEVGHFILELRKNFRSSGQFIATSHHPEAIRSFSDENTLLLHRRSHLDPTQVRKLSDIKVQGDLVSALIRGDVEP